MPERIISADSHFEIPLDKIVGYLPDKYKQEYTDHRAATLAEMMAALTEQSTTPALRNKAGGISTVAQVPKLSAQPYPAAGRAGGSDPYERLKDMDIDKVDAEVLYLNFGDVDVFYDLSNEACSAGFQAFTSAALDVAAPDPDRLVPVYPLLLHDIDLTIKECQRIANQGGRAVMVPAYPTDFNLAPYHDEIYDPLWSALEDMEMPVSQHVNLKKSGREISTWDPTPPKAIMQSLPPIFMAELLGSWVLTGIFDRHPRTQRGSRRGRHRLDSLLPDAPRQDAGAPQLGGTRPRVAPEAERVLVLQHGGYLRRGRCRHEALGGAGRGQRDVGDGLSTPGLHVARVAGRPQGAIRGLSGGDQEQNHSRKRSAPLQAVGQLLRPRVGSHVAIPAVPRFPHAYLAA